MDKKKGSDIVNGVIKAVTEIAGNSEVQKLVLGTYSDGTTRTVSDAISDEIYSPSQRGDAIKRINKKKKKKKHKKFKI